MTAPSDASRACTHAGSRRTSSSQGRRAPHRTSHRHRGGRHRRRRRHRPTCADRRAGRPYGLPLGLPRGGPLPGSRTGPLNSGGHRKRRVRRNLHAGPHGGPMVLRMLRDGPRRAHRPAAAAVCDGARSSNDYSSGRREVARLETASGFRSPRSTDAPLSALTRTTPGTTTLTGVTWFPVVCMADRLRTVKTLLGPNFTPNQATRFLRIGDVTPFTVIALAAAEEQFYRRDVSSRYISST